MVLLPRTESLESRLQAVTELAQAAEKVRHWHDHMLGEDEGMVVSAKSVRGLWAALANYKSERGIAT
jgi:hypothetical protein